MLWVKALHIVFMVTWFAGLFYLPRLFVYHANVAPGSEQSELFKVMEQRLLKFIMTPAMIVAWLLGMALVFLGQWFGAGWFHAKFALVILLTIMHGLMSHWAADFRHDRNTRSHKFYRVANEIPTVLMIAIVILATVKPF